MDLTNGLVKLTGAGFGLHTVGPDGHIDAVHVPPDWLRAAGWIPVAEVQEAARQKAERRQRRYEQAFPEVARQPAEPSGTNPGQEGQG